jgi:hypothetical protein
MNEALKKGLTLPQLFWNMPPSEKGGWIGMCLIHGATLPITIGNVLGWTKNLPPLSMVLMIWAGLVLYLWRAVATQDRLHIVSNSIGFIFQSVLLALIFLPIF